MPRSAAKNLRNAASKSGLLSVCHRVARTAYPTLGMQKSHIEKGSKCPQMQHRTYGKLTDPKTVFWGQNPTLSKWLILFAFDGGRTRART
jgi:hypothetical protein